MPVPIGGMGPAGTAPGRRRAFGPGMYSAEEIARARGSGGLKGAAGLKGVAEPGGAAGLKGAAAPARPPGQEAAGRTAAKGMAGAVAEGEAAGARGSARSAAGRGGGGLMQPAVGAGGGHGEDDGEHSDKYADKTDEHFTEGIQQVAPPVIGG
jgi:hypothetical protein